VLGEQRRDQKGSLTRDSEILDQSGVVEMGFPTTTIVTDAGLNTT